MNSSLGKSLSADMQSAKTLTEARDAISNLALYYGALNISEQMALIAINQQTHLDIKQILASMSQTMMDNWIGFASGGPIPGIADKSITTNQLGERLSLDLTETLIGSAIMGAPFDMQIFIANELGSYVGGKTGNKLISHYTQSTSKPPARSASQIQEDSLAPNDRHYITATAAGQGKGQSPDFLAAYAGMDEGDDLLNMMMGLQNTSNHPVVQTNTKAKATNQKLSTKKTQATAQGARVNYSDPFSELPQGMAEWLDPLYSATNNQAVHFKGNSLNPESHYYPQAASTQSSKVATTPGEALSKLAHLDLSDWGRPMASMEGHPGWGESLTAGAHWEYNHVVTDIDHINNGNFRQRIGGTISLGLDVVTALSVINPMTEGAVMAARVGYSVAKEAVPLVGRALEAVGFFGKSAQVVTNTVKLEGTIKHTLTGLSSQNVVRLADELGLGTPRNDLILWSGLGRGDAGIKISQEFARSHGGITLEMTPGGKWLNEMDLFGPSSPFTRSEARLIWQSVSTKMVQQASGQVRSLVGIINPNSIYRAEQAELYVNSKISGIDELNIKPRYGFN